MKNLNALVLITAPLWIFLMFVATAFFLTHCTVDECKGCTIELQVPKLPNCIEYVDGAFFLCPEAGADAGVE